MNFKFGFKLILTLLAALFSSFSFAQVNTNTANPTQSQTQFLVSWKAINYVPADYLGKIFPSQGTPIEVSFDLVDKNKIIDLSKYQIYWNLDNSPLTSGLNLKSVQFKATQYGGNSHSLRITVANYNNDNLDYIIDIPTSLPESVIDTRSNQGTFSLGNYLLRIRPFFFNVTSLQNLTFDWLVNSKPAEGVKDNPSFLGLNLESPGKQTQQTQLIISADVKNFFNQLETASKIMILNVK